MGQDSVNDVREMARPRSYIRLVAVSVPTLLPMAIFVLTLLVWIRHSGAGVGHAWMSASLLFSGVTTYVGIKEAMRTFHRQGSVLWCVIAVVAMFCGTAAAALALALGLPPLGCGIQGMRVVGDIRIFKTQLEEYRTRNGVYPPTEQWSQAFKIASKDPWGGDYVYRYPGRRYPNGYDLFSPGPDRVADTADDEWGK